MARKLPPEESADYKQALIEAASGPEAPAEAFTRALSRRSTQALELCPDLQAFFAREFPQMFVGRE